MTASNTTAPFRRSDRFFIGGQWATPSTSATIDKLNSGTEELFVTVAEAADVDVDAAVAAARKAFDRGPWPRLSPAERAGYLKAIAKETRARQADLAATWTIESGMIHSIALGGADHMSTAWDYYAGLADSFDFVERHPGRGDGASLLVREPVGVVAAIVPWNAPASLLCFKVAPALLAGCTVIVKVSPEAPSAGYIFAEICEAAGLPPGVFNMLTADRAVSEHLVRHPGVDKVTFTGSTAAGRKIASACGERIARYTLELGGKSAAVILDDYDIAIAADAITKQATPLTGQFCASLTRVIVPRARHDAMVEALADRFKAVKVGDPFDAAINMGPLATNQQRDRVEHYIAKGRAEGATLAAGGGRPAHLNRGYFIEPTVFGGVDNSWTIAQEEIFGPVCSVIPADDEAQAIEIANDTIFGLNNSVFTNDVERAYAVSRILRSGTVGHNAMQMDFNISFGGFKQSGVGREGGVEGLLPFTEAKTVLLAGTPAEFAGA